jgi:MFS family permease
MQAATPLPAGLQADQDAAPLSAWYALGVLTVVLMFATIDRAIIALLAEPIKKSLGLSDLQLGLIQGTGIAVFAALAAFPLAWLADKYGRRLVLGGSIVVWSAAVVGCAMARSFEQMMLATAMLGAGEAGLAPITYALIAEKFRGNKRQLANSVFVLVAAAGGGAAMVITGQLVQAADAARAFLPAAWQGLENWRISFLLAAMPAPVMVLLAMTIRQAPRVRVAVQQVQEAASGSALTLREHLRRHGGTLFPFFFGVGLSIFSFSAVGSWIAVICMRLFGQTAVQVSNAMAAIGLAAVALGFVISTYGIRYFSKRMGAVLQVRTIWIVTLGGTITSFSMSLATSATHVYAIQAVQAVMLTAASMLFPTALQSMAPLHLLGRVVAIQTTINLAMGASAAPLVGWISDHLSHRPDGLLVAASGVAVVGLLCATILLRWSERGYAKTIEDIARPSEAARP